MDSGTRACARSSLAAVAAVQAMEEESCSPLRLIINWIPRYSTACYLSYSYVAKSMAAAVD